MYRLLIVDDEPRIADSMCQLFRTKEELELEVFKAHSGEEAIQLLQTVRIDIVMTDIKMSGMSGLELLEKILEHWPHCKVIFLSGYSEFNYVYEAIHRDGVKYLLKTESLDVIIETVKDAIRKIDEEVEQTDILKKAKEQISQTIPVLRKDFIGSLLEGEKTDSATRSTRFKELDIGLFAEDPVMLVLGRAEFKKESMTYSDRVSSCYSIDDIFKHYIGSHFNAVSIVSEDNIIIWLIQPKGIPQYQRNEPENLRLSRYASIIKGNIELVQDNCRRIFNVNVSFVAGSRIVMWEDIYMEYEHLKNILRKSIAYGQQMVILKDISEAKNNDDNSYIGFADFKRNLKLLETYLDHGEEKEFIETYQKIESWARKNLTSNYFANMEIQYALSMVFLSYSNRNGIIQDLSKIIDLTGMLRLEIHAALEEFFNYYSELGKGIFLIKKREAETGTNEILDRINKYINDNLGSDLSLTILADIVYLNPSYLCRFYKQLTGRNLTEYIMQKRIEKAREFLLDRRLKINEIALKVGFESPSYFGLCFKKLERMSPQEYRDQNM